MQWLGPLVACTVLAALVGALVAATGILAFPASKPDPAGVTKLIHSSFTRSVERHSDDIAVPGDLDAPWRVMLGAAHFARVCSSCHGAPGLGQNPVALSMRPRPQYLPAVVNEFTPAQLFWIVKHGVKFSAMPAYPQQTRDDEIWSIVAFVKQIATIAPSHYRDLAYGPPPPATGGAGGSVSIVANSARRPYAIHNDQEPPVGDFSYTAPAMAFQDAALAGGPATMCAGCHGADGNGRAGGVYPNLTIQQPEYITAALRAFASGRRPSGIMQNVAAQLSDGQIVAFARRFGDRFAPPASVTPAAAGAIALGKQIADAGLPDGSVRACSSCHGIEGASPVGFPRLASQNAAYLRQQLVLFRAGHRGSVEGYDPMRAEAHNLTDTEIAAVASYYAGKRSAGASSGAARAD